MKGAPNETNRLYMSSKGERGLTTIQDSGDSSIQRLEDDIYKCEGRLIIAIRNNTDDTIINRIEITRKQKIGRKTTVWILQATNKRNFTRENWT